LSDEKKDKLRMDREVALITKQVCKKHKTKKELVDDLMQHDWGKQLGKNFFFGKLARHLREKALHLGIEVKKKVTHRIVPGWEGKGKGLLQVLWE